MSYDVISSQRPQFVLISNLHFTKKKRIKHTPLYTLISLLELFIYCRWYCLKALHVHENFYME